MCLLKAGIGPVIDCFDTNVGKFIDCLKGKGLTIGSSAMTCIVGCLAT